MLLLYTCKVGHHLKVNNNYKAVKKSVPMFLKTFKAKKILQKSKKKMFMNAKNGAGSEMSEGGCWPVAWATRRFCKIYFYSFFFSF